MQLVSDKFLQKIPELSYVTAENVARYRAIMRYFYLQYNRMKQWLKPEEVYQGVMAWGYLPDYTFEQCQADLEQLEKWKNLTSRHDRGRAMTIEEYLRKKLEYSLTPYSLEIERLLESLAKVTGYGGSLEPTLFDTIVKLLSEIHGKIGNFQPGEAGRLWRELFHVFRQLHENSADYLASLQTVYAEEMMLTGNFLDFKERLINYLDNFIRAMQYNAYKIEELLRRFSPEEQRRWMEQVAEDEWNNPRLEEYEPSKEELIAELRQGWENLCHWFIGDESEPCELTLLERATKEAISRIVRCVSRIQERKWTGLSRRKELDYLAKWFYQLEKIEDAHRLAACVFGLFPTRHLHGEDFRESDRADLSMWDEASNPVPVRSRSRKRIRHNDVAEAVQENLEKKRKQKRMILEQKQEEMKLLRKMVAKKEVKISELGVISKPMRFRLLQWIGRCTAAPSKSFRTPEGVIVKLEHPAQGEYTLLQCEDGELWMPDFRLKFVDELHLRTVNGGIQKEGKGDAASGISQG